jgi:hypothetical protein
MMSRVSGMRERQQVNPLSRTFSKTVFRVSSDRLETVIGAMEPRVRRGIGRGGNKAGDREVSLRSVAEERLRESDTRDCSWLASCHPVLLLLTFSMHRLHRLHTVLNPEV